MSKDIFTFPQLQKISREQGYKLASLEDANGRKLQPFNQSKVTLSKQLETIQQRLNNQLLSDGVYFVCMASNIHRCKDPDRYPIAKGKLTGSELIRLEESPKPEKVVIREKDKDVLTYESALRMQQEISDLKSDKRILEAENRELRSQIEITKRELSESLKEQEPSAVNTFLKEGIPSVIPILDRYFDHEDRKLALEEKKLDKGIYSGKKISNGKQVTEEKKEDRTKRKMIIPGSAPHILLIHTYYNANEEDKMNLELDKLERANPEIYKKVCDELGLDVSGEEDENE